MTIAVCFTTLLLQESTSTCNSVMAERPRKYINTTAEIRIHVYSHLMLPTPVKISKFTNIPHIYDRNTEIEERVCISPASTYRNFHVLLGKLSTHSRSRGSYIQVRPNIILETVTVWQKYREQKGCTLFRDNVRNHCNNVAFGPAFMRDVNYCKLK